LSYRLRVAPQAAAQIRAGAIWWARNRSKAPAAFTEDIEKGFELARSLPSVGEPVRHSRLPGVRRLLLARVRYHLYYSVSHETETVEILALWHTSRGTTPDL